MSGAQGGRTPTESSTSCTALFFRAEPHSTGYILPAMVAVRAIRRRVGISGFGALQVGAHSDVVVLHDFFHELGSANLGICGQVGGDVLGFDDFSPLSPSKVMYSIVMRSTICLKFSSVPSGIWKRTALGESCSKIGVGTFKRGPQRSSL